MPPVAAGFFEDADPLLLVGPLLTLALVVAVVAWLWRRAGRGRRGGPPGPGA